jgi:hypothetical protein
MSGTAAGGARNNAIAVQGLEGVRFMARALAALTELQAGEKG